MMQGVVQHACLLVLNLVRVPVGDASACVGWLPASYVSWSVKGHACKVCADLSCCVCCLSAVDGASSNGSLPPAVQADQINADAAAAELGAMQLTRQDSFEVRNKQTAAVPGSACSRQA